MNAKNILILCSIYIISLYACGPFVPGQRTCLNCNFVDTNLIRRNFSSLFVEKITVLYGMDNNGCQFAVLQCMNPMARDILIEWYGLNNKSLGITGAVKNTQKVVALITCNHNAEWIFTENDNTDIIKTATCEYIL